MQTRQTSPSPDWGHVVLVLVFAGLTVFYLTDAWLESARARNLILILPASILSLALCGIVLLGIFREAVPTPTESPEPAKPILSRYRTGVTMGLFTLYIVSIPVLGFDLGTALFLAASLLVDGERRPLVLIGVPIAFATFATLCFRWLLPYPMPILIL